MPHNLNRRDFLGLMAAGSATTALPRLFGATGERPNILYIMADDHDAHAIGAYGSRINQTPNLDRSLNHAAEIVRAIDPAKLTDPRAVGRKQLPTTLIGLLTHIAEHTQRHVGEAICAAKLARVS